MRYTKIIPMLLAAVMAAAAPTALAVETEPVADSITVQENGTVLVKDVDYTLEYKDNVNVGTATVIVHFIGNYSGEKEQTFNIVRKSSGGGGGGGSSVKTENNTNVTVTDKDGNKINVTKKEENGTVIITLPSNKVIKDDAPVTITVTDKKNNPVETDVVLKDKGGHEATGKTDADGKLVLPKTEAEPSPMPTDKPDFEHTAYISGYENGTFIPDGRITRAETASMLYRVLETKDNKANLFFTDLANGAWYIPAVKAMSEADIIHGYEDGTFRPDNQITRAEFVTMLMQNNDVQTFEELPFSDVSSDLWSADYIYSAYKAGYINGYEDGTFRPDSPITRAEAVKIINEVLERNDFNNKTNPFSDVSNTHWAYKQILEAAVNHNVN